MYSFSRFPKIQSTYDKRPRTAVKLSTINIARCTQSYSGKSAGMTRTCHKNCVMTALRNTKIHSSYTHYASRTRNGGFYKWGNIWVLAEKDTYLFTLHNNNNNNNACNTNRDPEKIIKSVSTYTQ